MIKQILVYTILILTAVSITTPSAEARYECEGSGCRGTRRFEILDYQSKQLYITVGYEAVMEATCQNGRRREFSLFYTSLTAARNNGTSDVLALIARANCSAMSTTATIYEVQEQI
jgi:hypothetical protein